MFMGSSYSVELITVGVHMYTHFVSLSLLSRMCKNLEDDFVYVRMQAYARDRTTVESDN